MRNIKSRSYYCPKRCETVTLVEYTRGEAGGEPVCGILSCSHQDLCAEDKEKECGKRVYPWATCPACLERSTGAENQEAVKKHPSPP